jgi:hypothetical protein
MGSGKGIPITGWQMLRLIAADGSIDVGGNGSSPAMDDAIDHRRWDVH